MPNHNYSFGGADYLKAMGSSWFISRLYHEVIDSTHMNWSRVPTCSNRMSSFVSSEPYHHIFVREIMKKSPSRLSTNDIGLPGEKVIEMAKEIAEVKRW